LGLEKRPYLLAKEATRDCLIKFSFNFELIIWLNHFILLDLLYVLHKDKKFAKIKEIKIARWHFGNRRN
jgi:hypothetical protein